MTLFDPSKNYPRGILREIEVSFLGRNYTVMFFPECHEVLFAHRHRWADSAKCDYENFQLKLKAKVNIHLDSWNLDDISSMKTDGTILPEDYWKDDDIGKIEEMLMWQDEDLQRLNDVVLPSSTESFVEIVEMEYREYGEEMEEWVNTHTFTEEEEEFFDKEITDMNLHYLRASAGPPTDEYLMNVNYETKTGLPDKNKRTGCWRKEEWCPELGRLSLISLPEDYGTFSTFNPKFKPFGIQWPARIQEKTEGECGEKRFSGLKSCGTWMEWTIDNEGRFVANGIVKLVGGKNSYGCIVSTEYGDSMVQHEDLLKHQDLCNCILKEGDEVKLLCKDNDVLQDWTTPIRGIKIIRSGPGACEEFAPCGWY